jgi:Flp pilus assembly protein TadD
VLLFAILLAQQEFSSVFTAHGQVSIEGFGPAIRAHVSGCGADGWTDSTGKFVVSGRVRAGGYLSCSLNVTLPGAQGQNIPLAAPAGSMQLGMIVLKPDVKGAKPGTISFLSLQVPAEAAKLKKKAQELSARNDWQGAERNLEAALKKYETDPEAWMGLGLALKKQGKASEAAFQRASELDPRYAMPLMELALSALARKDWASATRFARQSIEINPGALPEARLYLATALLNNGDFAEAENESRLAWEHSNATLQRANYVRGIALVKLERVAEAKVLLRIYAQAVAGTDEAKRVLGVIESLPSQ